MDNTVPFCIEELLDDNEEDDNIMMEEFFTRKNKSYISPKWMNEWI